MTVTMTEPPPEPTPETPPGRRPVWPWLLALLVLVLAVLVGAFALTRDDDDGAGATTAAEPAQTTAPAATTAPTTTTTTSEAVVVPDVVGRPAAEAAELLADEGLYVELAYVLSDEPAGNVAAQAYDPGTELREGDFVALNVSAGSSVSEYISVPDVGGLPLDEARQALEQARFETLALNLQDEVRDTDSVDGQTPEASAGTPGGSLVVVYVSP